MAGSVPAFPPVIQEHRALRGPGRGYGERARLGVVVLAFVGMVTGGLFLPLGGLNLTLDRAIGLVLLPLLVVHLLGGLGPRGPRRLVWLWCGWLAVLAISMLLTGDVGGHLVAFVTAVLPVAFFSLMTVGPLTGRFVDRVIRGALWLHVLVGVPVLAIRRIFGVIPAIAPFVDPLGRIKLLTFEPNLLGAILAFLILASLPRARRSAGDFVLYALTLAVLLGTLSKMPLGGFAIGLVLYGLLRAIALRRGGTVAVVLPLWIGGALLTVAIAALPLLQRVYVQLLDRSDAVASRLYLFRLAVQRFLESPLIGRGPGDFGLQSLSVLKRIGAYDRANLWIGQMVLSILHDSGVIGLLVYVVFLVALFARAARWIRAGSLDHAGYVAGFVSILIASQATTAHLLSLFGIAAGLVASTPFVVSPAERRQATAARG